LFPIDTESFFLPSSTGETDQVRLNERLLQAIVEGRDVGCTDVAVTDVLTQLVREELTAYGTHGDQRADNDGIRQMIRAMHIALTRIGIRVRLPFRDFGSFHGHWEKNGAYGSWQARREILSDLFEPIQSQIETLLLGGVLGKRGEDSPFNVGKAMGVVRDFLARMDDLREHEIELVEMRLADIYPTDVAQHDRTRQIEGDILRLRQRVEVVANEVALLTGTQVDFDVETRDEEYAMASKLLGLLENMEISKAVALPLGGVADPAAIREQLERLNNVDDSDPHQVFSYAKSLIESTTKTLLNQLNQPYDEKGDIPTLVREAQKALKMRPDTIAPTKKGRETIIRTMSNLSQVALSVAELRNEYGTDHGRTHPSHPLKSRHARLVRSMATAYCEFLLSTLEDRQAAS